MIDRAEMLLARHEVTSSGCWEWTGYANRTTGYGIVSRNELAHRVAYAVFVGPIPDGHQIHHACENRLCVNPEHLRAVTSLEHIRHHRATPDCPKCGGTRRKQHYYKGRPNGWRCMDCHSKRETARISRKRAEARAAA